MATSAATRTMTWKGLRPGTQGLGPRGDPALTATAGSVRRGSVRHPVAVRQLLVRDRDADLPRRLFVATLARMVADDALLSAFDVDQGLCRLEIRIARAIRPFDGKSGRSCSASRRNCGAGGRRGFERGRQRSVLRARCCFREKTVFQQIEEVAALSTANNRERVMFRSPGSRCRTTARHR